MPIVKKIALDNWCESLIEKINGHLENLPPSFEKKIKFDNISNHDFSQSLNYYSEVREVIREVETFFAAFSSSLELVEEKTKYRNATYFRIRSIRSDISDLSYYLRCIAKDNSMPNGVDLPEMTNRFSLVYVNLISIVDFFTSEAVIYDNKLSRGTLNPESSTSSFLYDNFIQSLSKDEVKSLAVRYRPWISNVKNSIRNSVSHGDLIPPVTTDLDTTERREARARELISHIEDCVEKEEYHEVMESGGSNFFKSTLFYEVDYFAAFKSAKGKFYETKPTMFYDTLKAANFALELTKVLIPAMKKRRSEVKVVSGIFDGFIPDESDVYANCVVFGPRMAFSAHPSKNIKVRQEGRKIVVQYKD